MNQVELGQDRKIFKSLHTIPILKRPASKAMDSKSGISIIPQIPEEENITNVPPRTSSSEDPVFLVAVANANLVLPKYDQNPQEQEDTPESTPKSSTSSADTIIQAINVSNIPVPDQSEKRSIPDQSELVEHEVD